jgi:hypothetical protein
MTHCAQISKKKSKKKMKKESMDAKLEDGIREEINVAEQDQNCSKKRKQRMSAVEGHTHETMLSNKAAKKDKKKRRAKLEHEVVHSGRSEGTDKGSSAACSQLGSEIRKDATQEAVAVGKQENGEADVVWSPVAHGKKRTKGDGPEDAAVLQHDPEPKKKKKEKKKKKKRKEEEEEESKVKKLESDNDFLDKKHAAAEVAVPREDAGEPAVNGPCTGAENNSSTSDAEVHEDAAEQDLQLSEEGKKISDLEKSVQGSHAGTKCFWCIHSNQVCVSYHMYGCTHEPQLMHIFSMLCPPWHDNFGTCSVYF